VTLSYAQSLDGSIAAAAGRKLSLSGRESLRFVHRLRAAHDAILVGIGTVLADDPQLTVREARGRNPQPIVADTHLRIPTDAYLLCEHPLPLLIAAGEKADRQCCGALEARGATVLRLPLDRRGRIDLQALVKTLFVRGIRRLMVEGGAEMITSFIREKLVDRMVITIAPVFVGGVPALQWKTDATTAALPSLKNVYWRSLGNDIVLQGDPEYA
jgi:3,4-dihydroxy 2-butanone 4-phosphate synthase/GTP cyclohydrolase II